MSNYESSNVEENENSGRINWRLPSSELIKQMTKLIQALKNKDIKDPMTLLKYNYDLEPSCRIFGMDGHHRCDPEIVSISLSLLVTLASSEEFTGKLIAYLFPKDCGGCMVYSILMLVGCFSDSKNIQLAFDFFRHVLADPDGEILDMNEVHTLSKLLSDFMTPQTYGRMSRAVYLEAHSYRYMQNTESERKMMLENLSHTIEGLGVLCTSQPFSYAMKTNRVATVSAVKQSRMENKFSYESANDSWR